VDGDSRDTTTFTSHANHGLFHVKLSSTALHASQAYCLHVSETVRLRLEANRVHDRGTGGAATAAAATTARGSAGSTAGKSLHQPGLNAEPRRHGAATRPASEVRSTTALGVTQRRVLVG